jgi:hypothetical protein
MRRWNLLAAMAIASIAACLPEQERTNYGPPESLGTRQFPTPQGGGDATDAGGGPSTSTLCGGKGPVATTCDGASWKKDIFGAMLSATGTMKCGSSTGCHAAGGNTPTISGTDSDAAYASLAGYKLSNKPYIDVCNTNNPDTSAIHGNLSGAIPTQMPLSPGVTATADQLTTIDTWLKCGAPNN